MGYMDAKTCFDLTKPDDLKTHLSINLVADRLNMLANTIHELNEKWWVDLETAIPLERNVGEMLMLAVSELAEAMEGHRKNLKDDHLPHRPMFEVELADCIIRCLDMGAGLGFDVGGALVEKLAYNLVREDHKREARLKGNGKKY